MYRLLFIIFLLMTSCSSVETRRITYASDLVLNGGRYEDKSWDESLEFKRFSWYQDATLNYDILITPLTSTSPFSNWLGSDKNLLQQCSEFFIALVYADVNSSGGNSLLINELTTDEQIVEKTLLDFSNQIKAHPNIIDWKIFNYKVVGLCSKSTNPSKFHVTVPGFTTQKIF
jgi:hypothetical protein